MKIQTSYYKPLFSLMKIDLIFIIIFSLNIAAARADFFTTTPDGKGGCIVTNTKGPVIGALVIPNILPTLENDGSVENLPVTGIGPYAFNSASKMTSVTIPQTVTSIGESAFYYCVNLSSATIPIGVTKIETYTFAYCFNLKRLTLGNKVSTIDKQAFESCYSLSSITLGNSLISVGEKAFHECSNLTDAPISNVTFLGTSAFQGCASLTNVTLSTKIKNIGIGAFSDCSNLTFIRIGIENILYSSENGVLFNKNKTILMQYPAGLRKGKYYQIPDTVTDIGATAFEGCGLSSITLPESIKSIGSYAMAYSTLSSIYFEGDAPKTNSSAFDKSTNLAIIYYLYGKEGWKDTLVKIPTVALDTISLSALPSEDGIVRGSAIPESDTLVTVTAEPKAGYRFVNWTKNATVVSQSAVYTFTSNGNVSLTAHFARIVR